MDTHKIWLETWAELEKACTDKKHPFYTAVLGSLDTEYGADLRTVVLRKALSKQNSLWFYTDIRSDKIVQIQVELKTSCLFYDRIKKIQLRLYGQTQIVTQTDETKRIWDKLSVNDRRAYMANPGPGTLINQPDDGLQEFDTQNATQENAYAHFAIIKTEVLKMDWLQLAKNGHRRISYQKNGNKWLADWLIP